MFIIVKIIHDIGKSFRFKSKMVAKYLDFGRFGNDSGSDYIQNVHICPKMTEQYKLTICVRLMW